MSTPKRFWYEGAMYHVTARGNRKDIIFREEQDYYVYLNRVKEAMEYYEDQNYKLISYCLMKNHVHLLIKTDTEPAGQLIGRIHSIYTRYFNHKYDYVGHLFQGRHHQELIKNDIQLLEASRYIHLNPVKANLVKYPEHYPWSSYKTLIGRSEDDLICSDVILNYFDDDTRHQSYEKYTELKRIALANTPGGP